MRSLVLLAACTSASSAPKDPVADHIAALRKQLAAKGLKLTIRTEGAFVVLGDSSAATLAREAETVRWATQHLEADFFAARPAKILDIYLFHGATSYQKGVKALTDDAPDTPYGFYSQRHGGLFMNISTGGGTLVHEIVHP